MKLVAKFFVLICLCIPAKAFSQLFDDIEFSICSTKSENYSYIFGKTDKQPFNEYEFSLDNGKHKIVGEFYEMFLLNTKNDKVISLQDRITILTDIQELTDKYGFEKLYISPSQNITTYKRTSNNGNISYLEINIPNSSKEFCTVILGNKINGFILIRDKSFENYDYYSYFKGQSNNDWNDCSHEIFKGSSPAELHTNGKKTTGFYSQASDKLNCISLVTREDETWEMVAQKLDRKLKKDSCYKFNFDTKYEKDFQAEVLDPNDNKLTINTYFDSPTSLKISLSNSACIPEEVIYLSSPIRHEEWTNSQVQFTPTKNYRYIILEASYADKVGFGHLLIDNFSDIYSVNCKGVSQKVIELDTLTKLSPELSLETDTIENLISPYLSDRITTIKLLPSDYESSSPGAMDPTRMIQSKSPGLNITANSYTPGASSRITFRGLRSFSNSNQPLILLDGLPIDNSEWNASSSGVDQSNRLIDIDPNNIETIDFERSMVARAKYGLVGANGVISIKTKKGQSGKPRITFSSTLSRNQVSNLPALQRTYAQGSTSNGFTKYRGPETDEASSWGPLLSSLSYEFDLDYPFDQNGRLVENGDRGPANSYNTLGFFERSLSNNQSLHVSGGFEKLSYALTGSLNNQNGVIPTNRYNRNNLGANLIYQPIEKLELQLTGNITSSTSLRSQRGSNITGVMLTLLRTPPSFDNTNGFDDPVNNELAYQLSDGSLRSYRPESYQNPYWSLNKNKHNDSINRQIAQLSAKYSLTDKLDLLVAAGVDRYRDSRVGGIAGGTNSISTAYERDIFFNSQNIDLSAAYTLLTTEEINLKASLGFNYNQRQTTYDLANGRILIDDDNVSITNVQQLELLYTLIDNKRAGGIFAVDFSYSNFLNITANLRQDYSNKFGKDTNGFISYGLGVDFSVLNWINNGDSPFELVLNGSYGKFGNDFLSGNELGTYVEPDINGDGFILSNEEIGFELNSIVRSKNFTAEETEGYDVGANFQSQEYGFSLGLLYYNEKSEGLVMRSPIATSSGFTTQLNNIGSIENNGFEFSLLLRPLNRRNFRWQLGMNFNKNNNKVTAFDGNTEIITLGGFTSTSSVAIIDHPMGSIYGRGFLRTEDGELVIGEEGYPLTSNDNMIFGDPNPDWTMFINNSFKIGKNVSISALIDIKQGGEMWCGTCGTLDYFGRTQLSADERGTSIIFDGVTEDGNVNTIRVELVPEDGDTNDNYRRRYGFGGITEMNVFDASWIRLRNLSVSYNLKGIIKWDAVRELKLSLFAENLFLITEYPGIDPETNFTGNAGGLGLDYYNNPGTKTIGANIKASF